MNRQQVKGKVFGFAVSVAFLACALPLHGQEDVPSQPRWGATFVTVDDPDGVNGTIAIAINQAGSVTGYYFDANGNVPGFLRNKDGRFTTFNVSGPDVGTYPTSINSAGAITGYTGSPPQTSQGFMRAPDGAITIFEAPGAGTGPCCTEGTEPQSINPAGAITGYYVDDNNVFHGFLRASDGNTITFDAPGAGTGVVQGTFPASINPRGVIAGSYFDAQNVEHGFVRAANGTFTTFDVRGACGTTAASINPGGVIAGGYAVDCDTMSAKGYGFVRAADGTITTFAVPGALSTGASSINPAGQITGTYSTTETGPIQYDHSYTRATDGAITNFDAPGAASGPPYQGTVARSINPEGVIVGFYEDAKSIYHGFLRIPRCAVAPAK